MQLIYNTLLVLATFVIRSWVQGQVTVSFFDSGLTVSEGEQFNVRITKSGTNEKAFVVIVEVDNNADGDFIGDSQVVRFERGASGVGSVSFTVKEDNIPEGPEIYYLHLNVLDSNVLVGYPDRLPVTITANDDAYGVFSLNEVSPKIVTEYPYTNVVKIKVKREVSYYDTVIVRFMVNSSSTDAVMGVDVLPVIGTVLFQPEQREANIELQILPDDIPENNESFFVTLTSVSINDAQFIKSMLEVIILANDAPVHFTQDEYRFEEGPGTKIVSVQVTRGVMDDGTTQIGPINEQASVGYSFISDSATRDDFTATDGTLIFSPGDITKAISFTIIDDSVPELKEQFSLRLLNLQGNAVLVTPNVATVIINANDNPSGIISFKADATGRSPSQRVNEDSFTFVNFVVVRTAGTFGEVSVSWYIIRDSGGSAPVTEDVGPSQGKLVFGNGSNEAVISLTVVQDSTPEPAEMFIIHLQPENVAGNALVEGLNDARLLIEDSDNMYGTVEFGPDNDQKLMANETPRLLHLSLTRSGGRTEILQANVTVTYDDGSSNLENEDVFVIPSKIITLPNGVDTVTANFELRQLTFLVIGGEFQAIINYVDFEYVPKFGAYNSPRLGIRQRITVPVSLSEANGETGFFNVTNQIVDEPVSGVTKVNLLVSREGLNGQANVRWSISGIDVTADDVEALQGILIIQSGMSESFLVIGIKADDIPEVTELLKVQLDSIEPSFTQRLRPGSTTVTITVNSNDNPGGVLQFSPRMNLSYVVSEGGDPITVIVERTGGDLVATEVQYSIIPNGIDQFYGATNIFIFHPGNKEASAQILARKDNIPELTEKYTLFLVPVGNPPSVLGNRTSIDITIISNDNPYGVVHFYTDPTIIYTVEGQLGEQMNLTIAVQRSSGTYGAITVPWAITPISQDDLYPSSGIIVFEPGQSAQNISLIVKNDDEYTWDELNHFFKLQIYQVPEGNETLALQLSAPQGGALPGIPMVATIVIQENDNPVEFVDPIKYVVEPQTIILTIRRQGRLDKQGKVHYRTLDGSASYLDGDYTQIQSTELLFNVGQQDKEVTVSVLDDDTPEGNETFSVQIFDVEGDLITTNKSTATIVILANDQAYGVFSFAQPAYAQVDEGSTIFYDVLRSRGSFGTVRVYWEIRSQNNIPLVPGDDFQVTSGQMDFSPQENKRPLGVSPLSDNIPEAVEQFLLVLTRVEVLNGMTNGNLTSLASIGIVATVVVTYSDDPHGSMAFAADARDLMIAEDFYQGNEASTQAIFTVERRKGTQNEVKVLWEIFSDQLGGNLPAIHDLLFTGQWPSSVTQIPLKQRVGTSTPVAQFLGSPGQYITVPSDVWPSLSIVPDGFSLSAWLQPLSTADGYVVGCNTDNGTTHILSLRITVAPTRTTLVLKISTQIQSNQQLNVEANVTIGDGQWHHSFVSVGNTTASFYLDGQLIGSRSIIGSAVLKDPSITFVGAQPPGSDLYSGYMQDVRIFMRAMDANSVNELYQTSPYKDITLISGTLTYSSGVRTQNFTLASRQDIEEEGKEVFAVMLLDTTGGATLAIPDSRTTLSVLKSDNANGLFGFSGPCDPSRILYENGSVTCTVQRTLGDDGTVTVFWIVNERQGQTLQQATADYIESNGTIVFLPGERNKTLVLGVKEETIPELDEFFDVQLTSVTSDDGLVGSTNTSGASIDNEKKSSQIVIQANDYPYGLLQFSNQLGVIPPVNVMILPVTKGIEVNVSEEGGMVSLIVQRAQGLIGSVRAEWRTQDITALSEGKSPPDYVGGVGSITMAPGVNYAFVNITVKDNSLPEAEKKFQVELFSPSGGAALGQGSKVSVTIQASDGAFGIFQFADNSLSIRVSEDGDDGFNSVSLQVLRLAGSIGTAKVSWKVQENEDDGLDIINQSGVLTFQPGEMNHSLDLQIRGDTIPELDETILVKLLLTSGGQLGDSLKTTATVIITANDDPYGKFIITSASRPKSVKEADQDVNIVVQRLGGKYGSVVVDFTTLDPSETYLYLPGPVIRASTEDFNPTSGTLSFGPGQELADFKVHILDDQLPEQDESIFVRLNGVRLVQAAQLAPVLSSPRLGQDLETFGQIIISNSDNASGLLILQPSNITVEETSQTLAVNIVRIGGTFGEVSVAFNVIDGTAMQNLDYKVLSPVVNLASGETSRRVPVVIIDDWVPEFSETFTIQLSNLITGGAVLGDQISTIVTILPSDDPNGLFEFVSSGQTVQEEQQAYTVDITVSRIGGFMDIVTIAWAATLKGQSASEDVSSASGSLFFVTNDTSRKISLTVLPDNIPEGIENIVITLLNATNGGRIGEKNTYILTIAPNDSPHGTVELSATEYVIPEDPADGPQTAQIVRRGGTYGTLRVYYSTRAMTVLDMISNVKIKPLNLYGESLNGVPPEAGSQVDVSHSNDTLQSCASVCLTEPTCLSFTVHQIEVYNICNWFGKTYAPSSLQTSSKGSYYEKDQLKLSKLLSNQAKAGEDFNVVSEQFVLILDGETTASIPIPVINDQKPELDEKFYLILTYVALDDGNISASDMPMLGQLRQAIITIRTNDNAFGVFSLYSATAGLNVRVIEVNEVNRFSVDLVVERKDGSMGSVSVDWSVSTVNRTATYGQDYLADGATLTFNQDQTTRSIAVTILDDFLPEGNEELTIQLTNPTGGSALSNLSSIRIVILANDNAAGVLSFDIISLLVNEGDNATIKVNRSLPALGTVTATWLITGKNGLQAAQGFVTYTGPLTFLPAETEKTISLSVLSDETPEINEEYSLTLQNILTQGVSPTGAASLDPQLGTVLITIAGSNDPHGVFQLAQNSLEVRVLEDAGTANLLVIRKFGAIGVVRVTYEATQGSLKSLSTQRSAALAGQDFVAVTAGSIDVGSGATSGTISVTIVNDDISEIDEVFIVRLTSVTLIGSSDNNLPPRLGSNETEAEVIIIANDGVQGIIQFSPDSVNVSVTEQGQTISLNVVRGNGTFGQVSVVVYSETVTQSVVQGQDYNVTTEELTFADGESRKSIAIVILDDNDPEPAETFQVILANPSNGALLGQAFKATITILQNDQSGGVITFDNAETVQLWEPTETNSTSSQVDILLRRGPGAFGVVAVSFNITTTLGQATNDVSPQFGTVSFSDGQATAILSISAVNDDVPELEETFTLILQMPVGGAVLGNIKTKTIIIAASDSPFGSIQIFAADTRQSNYSVEETFSTLEFDVVRNQGTHGQVTVDVVTVPGTASFSLNSSRVILAPISSPINVSVSNWCQVTIANTVYLIMLTSLNSDTQLASMLPASSPVGAGQSVIYKWQGQLTYAATILTDGATSAISFTISNSTYVCVTNSGREGKRLVSSLVYRVSQNGAMEIIQSLSTSGASDVEHFVYNSRHFLFITNSLNDSSRSDIFSFLFEWSSDLASFFSSPKQLVPTFYATAVSSFLIDNQTFVAVANSYDWNTNSFEISSVVYRMESNLTLVQHQKLATQGAVSLIYVDVGSMRFLSVANNRQNGISSSQNSAVYRWDMMTNTFVLYQTLKTSRAQKVTSVVMDDGSTYLVFANSFGNSEIFWWDAQSSQFKSAWKGAPFLSLQPVTVQQPSGTLYLLASAGVVTPSFLFQIAPIAYGSDFVPRRITMTFDPNQKLLRTSVVVLTDDAPEAAESFLVSLISPTGGAELGPMKSVNVTILTNDDAHGVVEFAQDSLAVSVEEKVNSDNVVQLNVTRRLGFFGRVTVDWIITGEQSQVGDITPMSGQVEFANGQSVATIALTIKDDKEPEFAEVTYVRLIQVVDGGTDIDSKKAKLGDNTVAVVTVLASDSPYGVVSWEKTSVTVSEPDNTDQSVDLVIIRMQGLERTIRVDYVTSTASQLPLSQQATSGEDYVSKQGSVIFAEGVSRAVVTLVIKQDSIPEDAESFFINITSVSIQGDNPGSGAPSIDIGKGVLQITILANDNAGGIVEMDVRTNVEGRFDVYEENGKNVTIELPLKRLGGVFGSVTVTWQANPIEANILDFYPASGTVNFQDQQRNASIFITIIDDTLPESMETFDVKLISITGNASLGQTTSVRVGILKNDSPTGLFRFATSQVETHESKNTTDPDGQVKAVVQRIQGTEGLVNVQWRLNVAETSDSDFLLPVYGTIQFLQGEIEKEIVLQTRPDTILEGREEFILSLVAADNNASISNTAGDCKIIILPDPGSSGVISILPESRFLIVGEPGESSPGYSGRAEVKLTRGQGIFGEVVVTWSLTPRNLSSFQQVEGSLQFLNLQQTASIVLQTRDDDVPELRQTFTFQITSASGGAVVSNITEDYTSMVIFAASDYPHGLVQFSLPQVEIVLEDQTKVYLTVIRDKGLKGQLSAAYSTSSGNATAYNDYLPSAGTLTFLEGQTNQTIEVTIVPDVIAEGPEDFYVNLTSVQLINDNNNYTLVNGLSQDMRPALGSLSTKIVRIDKNDNAEGTVQFSNDTFEVKEESGFAQVLVVRTGGKFGQVSVHYTTVTITATEGTDYVAASGDLVIPDGVGEMTLNITIRDDLEMEQSETFRIILSNVTGGALLGTISTATVTILKSDYPNGRFAFQGPTELKLPNLNQTTNQTLVIERTGGALGQQQVFWCIMGPNNPLMQLEDTSDISSTVDGREVTSGSFTWQDGTSATKQLILNIKAFINWEVEKSFVVQLCRVSGFPSTVGNGEVDRNQGSVIIKIERFGDPNGIVQFTDVSNQNRQVLEPDGSTPTSLTFPIIRKIGTEVIGNIQIYWEVRPNTINNTDIQPSNGSLILENGKRNGQIVLQILPDDVPEETENFSLILVRVEGGAQLDPQFSQSNFSIRYNDQPHGEFGVISEYQTVEVNTADMSRQIRLNFTRYQGAFGVVILTFTVQYDIGGVGVGLDTSSGTVKFDDRVRQAYVLVTITGTGFLRLNSTFTVYVTGVQFSGSGVTEVPTVRQEFSKAQIIVPALAANTELSFASDLAFVNEGDRTLTVTLVRAGTYGSLVANWVSGYSAADELSNVTNGNVNPALGSVNMAHGQEMTNVTVQVNPQVGHAEAFVLRLPRPPQSLVSGGARLATSHLLVYADPSGLIRFSDSSLTPQVSELDGQVTLTLWRLYGSNNRIAVHYQTLPDSAEANIDFNMVSSGVVVMEPLQTLINITLQINQDNIPEQTEAFYVNLTSVEKFPTPVQPVMSPRLSQLKSLSKITIRENNDPNGILSLRPTQSNIKEAFTTVSITVVRSGGVFGAISVTVRTVGGGESWTSQIAPNPSSSTNDTIADMLGKRSSQETATVGQDYDVLNVVVSFQTQETEKFINVTILEDSLPEPAESVLIYLTQPTGGARVARGISDGGLKGYAEINIAASDLSNGLIGFAESSKNVHVSEDTSPRLTLKLIRLNAFYGDVKVNWKAKKTLNSTDVEDADLSNQLKKTADSALCPPNQSQCDLYLDLIDDDIPEESYTFVVGLLSAETDAQLNEDSLSAMVTIDPSDDVKGLVQFAQNSRVVIVGENDRTVHLGVERVKGLKYEVSAAYSTQQMTASVKVSGVTVYPALETQDFRGQLGSLTFLSNSQELKYINISLTPVLSSDSSLPKQFFTRLSIPSNGARVNPQAGEATVRIVKEEDIPIWTVITIPGDDPFSDNNAIISVINQLEKLAENTLSEDNLNLIEDVLDKVNDQGNKRKFPLEVITAVRNLFCKLLDAAISDARRGRTSLVLKLEGFADTLVTNATCPPVTDYNIISTQCANVKISAGRWMPVQIAGHRFDVQSKDSFTAPATLPDIGVADDGTNNQCVDFHLLEYSSQTWFQTKADTNNVINDRIIGFGLKGQQSAGTQYPAKYTIHTPDRRIAAKDAKCVYFDDGSDKWVSPTDVCKVTNDLSSQEDDFVNCECSHMSSYAIIATTHSDGIIGYVTWFYVICFICMGALIITVAVHHLCFSHATFSASIYMHFFMAVFFTQMCLVIDAYLSPGDILASTVDNSKCIAMGLFLHYFFLAQFTWIAAQAVNLWKVLILNDEHTDRHYIVFFILGWGVPLVIVAVFYAVTFNIFKYHSVLDVRFIYGDVNNNGEICFITNVYSALGGILAPVLVTLLIVGIVFVRAYQLSSQWHVYDDVYHGRYNSQEIPFILIVWGVFLLTCLWLALHMILGYLWIMILFCIFDLVLALLVFALYAVIRNPLFSCIFGPVKASYSVNGDDHNTYTTPAPDYNQYVTTASTKGSRTSLLNESLENNRMTVRRTLPSNVYINPPVAVISPTATIDSNNTDFDDLIYTLKLGRSLTPSDFSRSFDDDVSQLSIVLDHYETKRIDIADTHV